MWLRLRTLIIKELLAAWRDPKGRIILIVPPVFQMLIFSFAATQDVTNVRMAVLNRDRGTVARDLIARFEGSPNIQMITYVNDEAELARSIDGMDVLLALHIPAEFSRLVTAGQPCVIQMILDGRRSNAAQIVAGYAGSIIERFNAELVGPRRVQKPPSAVVSRIWFNPNLLSTWNSVPGLVAILTTSMGLMVTSLSVARERELGTLEQLLVSPLAPIEIIIGKTVPAMLIGAAEATLILIVGVVVFHIPFQGSVVLFYAAMLVYLASVIGVGLLISCLAQTQQQAILGAFVFMVPAILLSGYASPIENMPDWLQPLTRVNPLRYYMTIVKGVFLKAMPASMVVRLLGPIALIAVVNLSASVWIFRRRVE